MDFLFPAPDVSVQITTSTSGAPVLGQNNYALTCNVVGAERLNASISYQWTKNGGPQTQAETKNLPFSALGISDGGQYMCQATVRSPYLNGDMTVMGSHNFIISSKFGCILCTIMHVDGSHTVGYHIAYTRSAPQLYHVYVSRMEDLNN